MNSFQQVVGGGFFKTSWGKEMVRLGDRILPDRCSHGVDVCDGFDEGLFQ